MNTRTFLLFVLLTSSAVHAVPSQFGACRYTGQTTMGQPNGKGSCTCTTGEKYTGGFQYNYRSGKGIYVWAQPSEWAGAKYVGQWKDDTLHGHGTLTYANGDQYTGGFKDDKREGQGSYTWGMQPTWSGIKFTGHWQDDEIDGHGTIHFPNGETMEADWQHNHFNGNGTFYYPNGDKFAGEFKNSLPDGQGTATFHDGIQKTGIWHEGILSK